MCLKSWHIGVYRACFVALSAKNRAPLVKSDAILDDKMPCCVIFENQFLKGIGPENEP